MSRIPQYDRLTNAYPGLTSISVIFKVFGGAVISTTNTAKGIVSVTQTGTGTYKVSLSKPYRRLVQIELGLLNGAAVSAGTVAIESVGSTNTTLRNIIDPNIIVQTIDATGTVANPTNNAYIALNLMLSSSSVDR